jgi:hypothetical protein
LRIRDESTSNERHRDSAARSQSPQPRPGDRIAVVNPLRQAGERRTTQLASNTPLPEGNIAITMFPYGPEAVGLVHPNGPDATTFSFFDDALGASWLGPFDAARGSPDRPALFLDRCLMRWGTLDRIGRVDVQPVNCQ